MENDAYYCLRNLCDRVLHIIWYLNLHFPDETTLYITTSLHTIVVSGSYYTGKI